MQRSAVWAHRCPLQCSDWSGQPTLFLEFFIKFSLQTYSVLTISVSNNLDPDKSGLDLHRLTSLSIATKVLIETKAQSRTALNLIQFCPDSDQVSAVQESKEKQDHFELIYANSLD